MENHFKSSNALTGNYVLNDYFLDDCQNTNYGKPAQFNGPHRQIFNRSDSSQSFSKQNQEHSYYYINDTHKYQEMKQAYYLNNAYENQQNNQAESQKNYFCKRQPNGERDDYSASQLKQFDKPPFYHEQRYHLQQQNLEEQNISLQNYMQTQQRQISNQISLSRVFPLIREDNQFEQNLCNERINQEQIELMQNQEETTIQKFNNNKLTSLPIIKQETHNNQNCTQQEQQNPQLNNQMKNLSLINCQNEFQQNSNQTIFNQKKYNSSHQIYKEQQYFDQINQTQIQNEIHQHGQPIQNTNQWHQSYKNNNKLQDCQEKFTKKQDQCFMYEQNTYVTNFDESNQYRDSFNNNLYLKQAGQQYALQNSSQNQKEQLYFVLDQNIQKQINFNNTENQLQNQNYQINYDEYQEFPSHIKNEYFLMDQEQSNVNKFNLSDNQFLNCGQQSQIQMKIEHKNIQNKIQQTNGNQNEQVYLANYSEQQKLRQKNDIYTQYEESYKFQLLTQDLNQKQSDNNNYSAQWQYYQNNKQNESADQNVSQQFSDQIKESCSNCFSCQLQNYENNQFNQYESIDQNASQLVNNQIKQRYSNNFSQQQQNYENNQINKYKSTDQNAFQLLSNQMKQNNTNIYSEQWQDQKNNQIYQQNEGTRNNQDAEQTINYEQRQSNNIQFVCKQKSDQEAIQVNNYYNNKITDEDEKQFINKLTPLNFKDKGIVSFNEGEDICNSEEKSFSQLNSQLSSQILEQEVREGSKFQIQADENSFYGLNLINKECSQDLYQIDDDFELLHYSNQSKEQLILNESENFYQQQNLGELSCDLTNIQKKNVVKNIMTSFKNFITILFQKEIQPLKKVKKDHQFQKSSISIFFQGQQQLENLYNIRKEVLKIHLKNEHQDQTDNEQSFLKKFKRYICHKHFNNQTLTLLLKHKQYSQIFNYFLQNFAQNWLINSKIKNLKSHQEMIEFISRQINSQSTIQSQDKKKIQQTEKVV
ncbi:hypothetical protein ABPG74_000681 [Tetrahymena malaccensis]